MDLNLECTLQWNYVYIGRRLKCSGTLIRPRAKNISGSHKSLEHFLKNLNDHSNFLRAIPQIFRIPKQSLAATRLIVNNLVTTTPSWVLSILTYIHANTGLPGHTGWAEIWQTIFQLSSNWNVADNMYSTYSHLHTVGGTELHFETCRYCAWCTDCSHANRNLCSL